jgi:hypothetical protein
MHTVTCARAAIIVGMISIAMALMIAIFDPPSVVAALVAAALPIATFTIGVSAATSAGDDGDCPDDLRRVAVSEVSGRLREPTTQIDLEEVVRTKERKLTNRVISARR